MVRLALFVELQPRAKIFFVRLACMFDRFGLSLDGQVKIPGFCVGCRHGVQMIEYI